MARIPGGSRVETHGGIAYALINMVANVLEEDLDDERVTDALGAIILVNARLDVMCEKLGIDLVADILQQILDEGGVEQLLEQEV